MEKKEDSEDFKDVVVKVEEPEPTETAPKDKPPRPVRRNSKRNNEPTTKKAKKEVSEDSKKRCIMDVNVKLAYREDLYDDFLPPVQHHFINELNCFQCGICKKYFKVRSNFEEHIKVHETNPKNFNCDICRKGFDEVIQFANHLHWHCNFKCHLCGMVFPNKGTFDGHVAKHPTDKQVGLLAAPGRSEDIS